MSRLLIVCALFALIGCAREEVTDANAQDGQVGVSTSSRAAGSNTPKYAAIPSVARRSFANLPDRGELLEYGSRARNQTQIQTPGDKSASAPVTRVRGAYTWHQVAISEAHALRAIVDGQLHVRMPSGERLQVLYDHHVEHPSGDLSWVGHVKGHPTAQTILTFGAEAVYGVIGSPGKRAMDVTTENGATWLIETDPAKLVGINRSGALPREPDYLKVPRIRPQTASMHQASLLASQAASAAAERDVEEGDVEEGNVGSAAAGPVTIDLLLGYTRGYAPKEGLRTRLNSLVQIGNEALANSGLNVRLRLVHSMQVNYSDTVDNATALEQLTGYDEGEQRQTTPHAAFNGLRAAREQYGADLVSLIRPFRRSDQGGCGIAWLLGSGRSGISAGDEYFGYSIVSDGVDGATPNAYYCATETLIHEIGHNLGAQHDRDTAAGSDGELDDEDYGAFKYSFGYKTSVAAGNFHTVMAYGDEGQTLHLLFSSPRITSCGGRACGTKTYEDNARALQKTAPIIAGFRQGVALPTYIHNDIDRDGKSDLLFHYGSGSPGKLQYWIMNGATRKRYLTSAITSGYKVAATGDFNRDGRGDIVWVNASRSMSMWLSDGTRFQPTILGTFSAGWKLVGAGDIDGDGRSDLIFHNATTNPGMVQYWIMEGTKRVSSRTFKITTGYQLSATGDFNRDGRLDLLWTNAARKMSMWIGNGTTFNVNLIGSYSAGWALVGAADINGDVRSDLLFHNAASNPGRLQYWVMNGSKRVSYTTVAITRGYRLSTSGDFNGDGKTDLLWTNSSRMMSMWLSKGSGFSAHPMSAHGAGWVVVR